MSDKKEKGNTKGKATKGIATAVCIGLGVLIAKKLGNRKNDEVEKN